MNSIVCQINFTNKVILNCIFLYGSLSKEKYFNKLHSINLANISPLRNSFFINLVLSIYYISFFVLCSVL